MNYINHRINTILQLKEIPKQHGVELDVRYHKNNLVLHHDPFHHHENNPNTFEDLLKNWCHDGYMIINVKTEGIEEVCINLINKYKIKNWFFLDLSMPYFVKYAEHAVNGKIEGFHPNNLAVRFSEREPIEYTLAFAGKATWVWVDCFTYLPITHKNHTLLKKAGFKICLVSPELQKHSLSRIDEFIKQCQALHIDAICTKRPDLWEQKFQVNCFVV